MEQLGLLDRRLEHAANGESSIVLISGEAGIGKTRFASEVAKHAEMMGFRCLQAKCKSDAGSPLYLPWIQFFSQLSHMVSAQLFFKICGANVGQVVRLVPELSESVHPKSVSPVSDSIVPTITDRKTPEDVQREEMQFLLALNQVFLRLSENAPLLLVFDDMQWCDAASLKVINFFIANNFSRTRILLLCLYRDVDLREEANPVVAQFIETLQNQSPSNVIHLSRFNKENVADLLNVVFAPRGEVDTTVFRQLLHPRTGGNPLFIEETLKSLLERHLIFKNENGVWTFPKVVQGFQLPDTIKTVIEQRLERLDASTLSVLEIASVIGEQFSADVLRNIIDQDGCNASLESSLGNALKSDLIIQKESSNSYYIFSDESVRDVLYERLDSANRQNYHLKVAQILDGSELEGDLSKSSYSELAYHFLKGGNPEKALEYFVKAARRASELYAHAEAYAYYKIAVELIESRVAADQKQNMLLRADLLKSMGDESQFLPQFDKPLECWKEAAGLYEKCGELLKAADVYVKLGMTYHLVMYELQESAAVLERAVQLANKSSSAPSGELARITAYSMVADIWKSDKEKVRDKSNLALKLAVESNSYDVQAMVSSYVIATNYVHEIEEAIESCNRGLKISLEHDLIWEASYNYFHRAASYNYTCGPSKKSLALFLEGLNFTASRNNFMANLFHKVELLYGVYLPLGEWTKAKEMAEDSLRSVKGFPPNSLFRLITESAMGHVLLHEGDVDQAEEFLEHVRKATNGFGILQLDVPLYIALARLNLERGNSDRAKKYLEDGYKLSKQRGLTVVNGIPHIQLLSLMIEFALSNGSEKEANQQQLESLFVDLSKSAKKINQPWTSAYVYRAEGLIAQHRGDAEKARLLLQKSIEIFGELGWPFERAKTICQLGLARLQKGRVMEALENFDAASEVFSELGAKRDLSRIRSLRNEIKEHGLPILDKPPKFEDSDARLLFETLVTEFLKDFLVKKLEAERCGWRSLSELHRSVNLSKYSLYGRSRGDGGPVLKELLSTGAVEARMFAGERGRGGEVMKIRMSYNRAAPDRYAAQRKRLAA